MEKTEELKKTINLEKEIKMLEVTNIQAINKGTVLCKCDVRVIPWKMTMHDVLVFEKGQDRYCSLPTEKFETREGEVKYKKKISFDTDEITRRFQSQVMKAIDEYLAGNPEMEPEPVVTSDQTVPF